MDSELMSKSSGGNATDTKQTLSTIECIVQSTLVRR